MPNLLVVSNCPSDNTHALQNAIVAGCQHHQTDNIHLSVKLPLVADAQDVLWADGLILGSTENFGYMAGQVKDFFERIYYPCLELTEGLPVAVFIKGGLDGQGAKTSIERIMTGLKWKLVSPVLVLKGPFKPEFLTQCEELGGVMAVGLDSGIF